MSKPDWLREVQEFCRETGIEIAGWGADTLVVIAKSPDRAKQIASQLETFGFRPMESADDAGAGLLQLSRDPAATESKIARFDVSRRPLNEQLVPVIWAAISIGFFLAHGRNSSLILLGIATVAIFFWHGIQIWGWALEILPDELRVRRSWRWSAIAWDQILGVETARAFSRNQESVILKLSSGRSENLGTFWGAFTRNLRDRLRHEIVKRH